MLIARLVLPTLLALPITAAAQTEIAPRTIDVARPKAELRAALRRRLESAIPLSFDTGDTLLHVRGLDQVRRETLVRFAADQDRWIGARLRGDSLVLSYDFAAAADATPPTLATAPRDYPERITTELRSRNTLTGLLSTLDSLLVDLVEREVIAQAWAECGGRAPSAGAGRLRLARRALLDAARSLADTRLDIGGDRRVSALDKATLARAGARLPAPLLRCDLSPATLVAPDTLALELRCDDPSVVLEPRERRVRVPSASIDRDAATTIHAGLRIHPETPHLVLRLDLSDRIELSHDYLYDPDLPLRGLVLESAAGGARLRIDYGIGSPSGERWHRRLIELVDSVYKRSLPRRDEELRSVRVDFSGAGASPASISAYFDASGAQVAARTRTASAALDGGDYFYFDEDGEAEERFRVMQFELAKPVFSLARLCGPAGSAVEQVYSQDLKPADGLVTTRSVTQEVEIDGHRYSLESATSYLDNSYDEREGPQAIFAIDRVESHGLPYRVQYLGNSYTLVRCIQ